MSELNQDHDLIDMTVLQSLRSYARSTSFMPQLVHIFEEHGRTSLDELHTALRDHDSESVRRVAHRFKGSCLNMGAQALARELKRLESEPNSITAAPAIVESTYSDLSRLFSETCNYLKSLD